MVDPEIIAVNPNTQNIFYTCSTPPHTSDEKIEVLLLLYTGKLQVMRDGASYSALFQFTYCHQLWTMYIDNMIGTFDLKRVSLS